MGLECEKQCLECARIFSDRAYSIHKCGHEKEIEVKCKYGGFFGFDEGITYLALFRDNRILLIENKYGVFVELNKDDFIIPEIPAEYKSPEIASKLIDKIRVECNRANGARRARIMEVGSVLEKMKEFVKKIDRYDYFDAGQNTTGLTTGCMIVRDLEDIYFKIENSPALNPTPGTTWSTLKPWRKVMSGNQLKRLNEFVRMMVKLEKEEVKLLKEM